MLINEDFFDTDLTSDIDDALEKENDNNRTIEYQYSFKVFLWNKKIPDIDEKVNWTFVYFKTLFNVFSNCFAGLYEIRKDEKEHNIIIDYNLSPSINIHLYRNFCKNVWKFLQKMFKYYGISIDKFNFTGNDKTVEGNVLMALRQYYDVDPYTIEPITASIFKINDLSDEYLNSINERILFHAVNTEWPSKLFNYAIANKDHSTMAYFIPFYLSGNNDPNLKYIILNDSIIIDNSIVIKSYGDFYKDSLLKEINDSNIEKVNINIPVKEYMCHCSIKSVKDKFGKDVIGIMMKYLKYFRN